MVAFLLELDDDHLVVGVLRELERVVHQVHQDLHHGIAVHHERDLACARVAGDCEREPVLFDVARIGRHEVVEDGLGPILPQLHCPTVAVEFGQIKYVLDEPRKPFRLACDKVVVLVAFLFVCHPRVLQQLGVHLDRGERRLEFVTHRRDEVLPFLREVQLALREAVDGNEAATQEQEHDSADEDEQVAVRNELVAGAGLFGILVDVHGERNPVERLGEGFLEYLECLAVPVAERDDLFAPVEEPEREVVVAAPVVVYLETHDALEVFAEVHDESLDKVLLAAQHAPVECDVAVVQFDLERFDGDVHRAHVGENAVESGGIPLGRFHVECELFLLGSPFHAQLLFLLALGEVHLVGELVECARVLERILRSRFLVLDAHVADDELEPVLERFADFAVFELHLAECACGQVGRAEHAVGVDLEMPDESRVLAAVVRFRRIVVARRHREVEGEVGICRLLTCRDGLCHLDEAVFHERPLVLDGEVVLDAVVGHLEHLVRVHGPFRLGIVLHVQVRVIEEPCDGHRYDDEDCNEYYN